ncbi:MAG TPA: vitamin B12-dependent ribonucleotide reductase [Nitrospirales bacterium]|nr:vitamin B12-dependent ribonucleotide reductase [Nitrospirales bacterium]
MNAGSETDRELTVKSSLPISSNALRVLQKRYLAKDEAGKVVETPEGMFRRVAQNLAQADRLYGATPEAVEATEQEFYDLMARLEFLPNSPTLMNAGRPLQQLAACFVLPVEDSIAGIYDTLKHQALIHQTGGGTGFSFSRLRPKDDMVRSTGGVASGPVSFMKVYNQSTEHIKQGGTRRGANMGILRVDHPDILEFVTCKTNTKEITNFNISVAITDAFMRAALGGEKYDLISPRTGKVVKQLNACEVLTQIAESAWRNGEPGLFFIDQANRTNPTPHYAMIEATNPCGEQPLLPYESCNLGSVNLENHLIRTEEGRYEFDWNHLERTIRTSVHFLDNVIDMNKYPIPEIEKCTKDNRKIGLGVMGFARMLFKLGIQYDSEMGVEMGARVMKFISETGYGESMRMAGQRGVYPSWKGSLHEARGQRVRNSYVTTVAPTGTISMIAETSGGCEPEFSLIWFKNVMDGEHLPYVLDHFIETARQEEFWKEGLLEKILANHGSGRGIPEIPERWQKVFTTAHDVTPEWHVKMQAAFQKYTDSGVSKTINLSGHATVDDVMKAYLMAYDLGCKGITVYRDGSREEQVMNIGVSTKQKAAPPAVSRPQAGETAPTAEEAAPSHAPPDKAGEALGAVQAQRPHAAKSERPVRVSGETIAINTSYGKMYLTINSLNGQPFETFATVAKAGGMIQADLECVCRLISLALRYRVPLVEITKQLIGIQDGNPYGMGANRVLSLWDAIAKALASYHPPSQQEQKRVGVLAARPEGLPCPDCKSPLVYTENCEKCYGCGYSRCW